MNQDSIIQIVANLWRGLTGLISQYPWAFGIVILLVLGSRAKDANDEDPFHNIRVLLATHPVNALKHIFYRVGELLRADDQGNFSGFAAPAKVMQSVLSASQQIRGFLKQLADRVDVHVRSVMNIVERDSALRPWRVAGALICLFLLAIFVYADIIQSLENIALLLPGADQDIDIRGGLGLSIIVSSIGTLFTLSFILIDTLEITHFIPWQRTSMTAGSMETGDSSGRAKHFRKIGQVVALLSIVICLFW